MGAERGSPEALSTRASPLPIVLAVVVALLLVALGTLAARSDAWVPPRSAPDPPAVSSPSAAPTTTAPATVPPVPPAAPTDAGDGWLVLYVLVAVALLLLLGGVVALAAALGRISWRRRGHREKAAGLGQGPGEADISDPLPAAVHRALTAVTDQPDAREAVVRAWLLLGEAAAAAGTARRSAETAGEYAERLAAAHDLPRTSVERLATLYREARFSQHTVVAEQRDAARTELLALQAALSIHAADASSTRPPA